MCIRDSKKPCVATHNHQWLMFDTCIFSGTPVFEFSLIEAVSQVFPFLSNNNVLVVNFDDRFLLLAKQYLFPY